MTGKDLQVIPALYSDTLEFLKLSNNLIRDFEVLGPIWSLQGLINLDMSNNPVTDVESYRERVFERRPELEVLDGLDREGNEVNSEND